MWETDSREQTRQQATYNKLEEAVLKLEETNARIAGYERLLHELRTLPEDEAVRLFWRIRSTAPGGGTGSSSTDPADSESFDWLVGGAGGMSIDEDEYGGPGGGMTHQQQLAGELPPPPPFGSAMDMDVGMGEQGQQQHHHHHQHQQYGEGAYEEGQMYGERHRHH
ncbi:hypothetical protein BFW01_g5632 [Lasiodiplodia theobromae]|uniref:Uncharacterized protein n=1 Tax=Lasiodiplodia theobromae TaxID=45133 RepID=A0A5N5DA46_9PEZI|nr:uncharacterized protein LTHEOB_716 [Lasiodiplodia theobromae]KAB2574172.1 hypothetical protein DBV05_g7148 [Lasiodiplodia theobromae]KAF4540774.1 hypothetical protein LTHEOB_716 [Lasiodiplodia theobromae]KAF9634737.1 hypothetical protein BFW01_g5632 [Lasiodiplodia theobromae]